MNPLLFLVVLTINFLPLVAIAYLFMKEQAPMKVPATRGETSAMRS